MKKLWFVLLTFVLVAGIGVSTAPAKGYVSDYRSPRLTESQSVSTTSVKGYVSGNIGAVIVNDADFTYGEDGTGESTFDTGVGLSVAAGISFDEGFRGELEFGYKVNDIDKIKYDFGTYSGDGDFTTISIMGNVYYNFPMEGSFSPFICGGIGFANIEADADNAGSEDDNVFAYQFGVGGSFALNQELVLDVQCRFFETSDLDLDGDEVEYNTQNFMIGLRYSF